MSYPGIESDSRDLHAEDSPGAASSLGYEAASDAASRIAPGVEQSMRLGAFIRLHRQRVDPKAAGFAATSRRRTPGLRREELALLCDVSLTWITWLEQGRDVAASAAVLARLAHALRLRPAERTYLFDLAGRRDPVATPAQGAAPADAVLRSVQAMQCPAYVLDRRWDVVAGNARAVDLFLGWGESTDQAAKEAGIPAAGQATNQTTNEAKHAVTSAVRQAAPNLLRFLFLTPDSRTLIHDWEARSSRLVAEFRADCGRLADTAPIRQLIDDLSARSSDFSRCWQSHDVLDREGGERRFTHPRHGPLRYEQLTLHPAVRSDLKLVMLLEPTAR